MCKAVDVAHYIVDVQTTEAGLNISHLKLQKLVFYTQSFHLAITNEPLFEEDFQAWQYGPVEPSIYKNFKMYGNSIISPEERDDEMPSILPSDVSADSVGVISSVLNAYGHLSAIALMEKTHREDPWKEAYTTNPHTIIPKETMKVYYKSFLTSND